MLDTYVLGIYKASQLYVCLTYSVNKVGYMVFSGVCNEVLTHSSFYGVVLCELHCSIKH